MAQGLDLQLGHEAPAVLFHEPGMSANVLRQRYQNRSIYDVVQKVLDELDEAGALPTSTLRAGRCTSTATSCLRCCGRGASRCAPTPPCSPTASTPTAGRWPTRCWWPRSSASTRSA
ncbi:MAG: hypothetical protein WKG07_06785 [Hymenobacter sp.]